MSSADVSNDEKTMDEVARSVFAMTMKDELRSNQSTRERHSSSLDRPLVQQVAGEALDSASVDDIFNALGSFLEPVLSSNGDVRLLNTKGAITWFPAARGIVQPVKDIVTRRLGKLMGRQSSKKMMNKITHARSKYKELLSDFSRYHSSSNSQEVKGLAQLEIDLWPFDANVIQ